MKMPNSSLSRFFIGLRTFPWCNITILDSVDSTNNYLKINGTKHGQIVISKTQTNGKGTKGRSFYSPNGTGLYMSVLFKEKLTKSHTELLTCAAAAAVAEAIEIICGTDAKIKWINDIYVNDKKVCGILTESKLSPDGIPEYVIVGIGVNLFEPKDGFKELSDIAGSVLKKGRSFLFNSLAAEIVNRLKMYIENIEDSFFLDVCRQKSCVLGKNITITTPESTYEAYADSIDQNGRLIVTTSNKSIALTSADISIKIDKRAD